MATLAVLAAWLVAACGQPSAVGVSHVEVFAAASLRDAFRDLGAVYENAHSGSRLDFNFAGSSTLATQIQQGAEADLFASADEPNMQKLVDAGLVDGNPRIFAANRLQIVVGAGNPKHVARLADLARPSLVVALCSPDVPAGRYALQAFGKSGVRPPAASQEPDVRAVVSKVALGEADAGVVYVTDVRGAGEKVEGVDIPDPENVVARYPIARLKAARDGPAAQQFIDELLSAKGQDVLARRGFARP
jgi:molybdate transport system substrate-binding protein